MSTVDLACFSYLAAVQTIYVDHYPQSNYGALVFR
jgi:hypothetical protein